MDMKMVDVLVHVDETLENHDRGRLQDHIRELDGVLAVSSQDKRPHLISVEYDPDRTSSQSILAQVHSDGLHAELVGL
ncbi:MAG: ATP-binding protein [Chromatiales bacterium]|nr:ATP-binding protein [Chromatiales bacterium]